MRKGDHARLLAVPVTIFQGSVDHQRRGARDRARRKRAHQCESRAETVRSVPVFPFSILVPAGCQPSHPPQRTVEAAGQSIPGPVPGLLQIYLRVLVLATELVLAKQNSFWQNRTRSGETEPVLAKQNSFWQNRTRSGETEPVLAKQNPFWQNRTRSGKTEPVLAKQN